MHQVTAARIDARWLIVWGLRSQRIEVRERSKLLFPIQWWEQLNGLVRALLTDAVYGESRSSLSSFGNLGSIQSNHNSSIKHKFDSDFINFWCLHTVLAWFNNLLIVWFWFNFVITSNSSKLNGSQLHPNATSSFDKRPQMIFLPTLPQSICYFFINLAFVNWTPFIKM